MFLYRCRRFDLFPFLSAGLLAFLFRLALIGYRATKAKANFAALSC